MAFRNYSVDVARGVLMLYIVGIIHGVFWLGLLPTEVSALLLFEMPCVFIITGYAYFLYQSAAQRKESTLSVKSYFAFLLGRFTRIVVPYFGYAVFCIGYSYAFREPNWSLGEIAKAWLNPFQYGQGYSVAMLNWHLWFIVPYLAITAVLPLVSKLTIPLRVPLWIYMVGAAAVVYLGSLIHIQGIGLLPYVVSYGLWAVFGYHLAKVKLAAKRVEFVLALVVALLALLAFQLYLPAGYSLNMQANKFPPNFIFFMFCAAWVAFLLLLMSFLPDSLSEKLSRQVWLRPFISNGYSMYIWQGAAYSLAAYLGGTYQYPAGAVWGGALILTLIFGTIASPLEKLRVRKAVDRKEQGGSGQNVIVISDRAEPGLEDMLGKGLDEFNNQAGGLTDRRPLCVIVKDSGSGEIMGGATGRTSLGLAFLDMFHLPDALRGSGLGTKVLEAFENEARKRGCGSAVLYTISFQAPGFYEKNGWVRFGEIPSQPGISRIFMTKKL